MAYYGDDFTGSTDVLESLELGGVPTALFVSPPTREQWALHPKARALGVAGVSRRMSPAQMNEALPAAFAALVAHQPRFLHYKVCSTFDSSPQVGSIGRAIELGQKICHNRVTPLLVAAPSLGRYCAFGNLFARTGRSGEVERLDRLATMAAHPVTPMREADLRRHLAAQSAVPVVLVNVLTLDRGVEETLAALDRAPDGSVALFDAIHDEHLATVGYVIDELQMREGRPLLVVGSSGIERALLSHWNRARETSVGQDTAEPFTRPPRVKTVGPILVLSGSCSPVTSRQIAAALAQGFVDVPLDIPRLLESSEVEAELRKQIADVAANAYAVGRSVVVHSHLDAVDDGFVAQANSEVGAILGRLLMEILPIAAFGRIVVAGGDTSGHVARVAGISSLKLVSPLEPGAPLCVAESPDRRVDGLEFVFKGGQIGSDEFFSHARTAGWDAVASAQSPDFTSDRLEQPSIRT